MDPSLRDDAEVVVDGAVTMVTDWLMRAGVVQTAGEARTARRLAGVVTEPAGVAFTMSFLDRVIRAEDDGVAARQLRSLVRGEDVPRFLSRLDTLLLRAGSRLAPIVPGLVMPIARRRLRQLVGHLVVDADPAALRRHLARRRAEGFALNVNPLGEAVLGRRESDRRFGEALRLLEEPDVDYVSVKLSALVPRLDMWAFDESVERVSSRLRELFDAAGATSPPTFINLDMEEYHDLELTLASFMAVLDEPGRRGAGAGIALQAYLPDSFDALRSLVTWANETRAPDTDGRRGPIKIRLVKGANLAMERVEAAMHGWEMAPYGTKAETDANYKRCVDWVLTPDRTASVRVGVASHNLFDVAWSLLLAARRGVGDRIEIEMLEGMAPTHARLLAADGDHPLLYTPAVSAENFDVAISYLFRRLQENSAEHNFIRHLFSLRPDSTEFETEAAKFRTAVGARATVSSRPRRTQVRDVANPPPPGEFGNEPDSDPAVAAVRSWARDVAATVPSGDLASIVTDVAAIDAAVDRAVRAQPGWGGLPADVRRRILHEVADEFSRRRGELISTMMYEARKVFAQADTEVSEAIDLARWYGDRVRDLDPRPAAVFEPVGVVTVAPPWNFPVAITAGGTLAALAAGNAVLLKPAPQTPRCAAVLAECCWAAGVPREVLQLVRARDDDVGRRLITHPGVGAVVLTGSFDTARLFRAWRPDLRLFAETSGKNAMVITPSADVDLAVADLVTSAFGHTGQKCSAASLAICVGHAYHSPRLRRQLIDAVGSLRVGPATELGTEIGPLIAPPGDDLHRALHSLEPDETWLVEPQRITDDIWRPGVRLGVRAGSWFHQTECFGPVLGMMHAADLDEAIEMQNATPYGLTGAIHTLDPDEIRRWTDRVEVGNAYVNRSTTGAIVRRQPFGGWKHSSVGPGAKTGGPNYVSQFGTWQPRDEPHDDAWLAAARRSDDDAWTNEFGRDHDPTGLFCESNTFRYRPLTAVAVRDETGTADTEIARILTAADRCHVAAFVSSSRDEPADEFAARLSTLAVDRIRVVGPITPEIRRVANARNLHIADQPVTRDGRIELQHYLREQTVTQTRHRYGNLIN